MIKIKKYQIEDYISDATQDALDLKADLVDGKVPASQLPSFVDDVIEVANYAALPIPGASGVIYITLDTNKVYRWSGSVYVEIASGVTNLSYTPGVSNGTVNSDTGSDAIIPLAGTVNAGLFSAAEKSKLEGIAPNANVGVIPNAPITGATKTKITYDTKGLVTVGEDATTADIADSTNKRYVTDANLTVINNTSGTNTGDNATNSQYSGLAASKQDNITLTTTGTSGASTLVGSTLNIPQYSGATNLSYTASPTNGIVNSSTGTGATITLADATNAGLLKPAKFTVLENTSGTNTGDQTLQQVTNLGATTTNSITADSFIKDGGLSTEYLMADGTTTTGGTGGSIPHATASGTDTYTATVTGVVSYSDGDAYLIRFTNGNTTVATLNINGLGAIPLYRNNDGPLIGGDVQANGEMLCAYNSTANIFQCIGTSPNSIISYVTNADSVTITKGQVVYAFGGTGDRMTVKLASNIGDSTSAQTVGIVLSSSIAAGQKGFIMFQGLLDNLSILPTGTWADGDSVYLGATAGSITKVKPYAPNHLVYIGIVTTASNGSAGRMYVRVQNGYELDELHNVQAQTPTLKDTLWYDNTVSPAQWKTASISTILGYTPVNKAGDTMTGSLVLNANPTIALGAATKSYVDTLINGIDWKSAANAATTAALPGYTVVNSGQILAGSSALPTIDGVTLTATQRLLVKNETSTLAPNNGIYVVTQVDPFILTRSSDANTSALLAEATISISGGSTLSNTQWHCNPAAIPIVIGTTNIAFVGIGANAYTFSSPLINTSNVISVLNASATQSGVVTTGTQTFAGTKTFSSNPKIPVNGGNSGAGAIVLDDGSGQIQVASNSIYPNTTELAYVKGVTSGIQDQFSGKQPLSTVLTNTTASFTIADETKLDGIAIGANVGVVPNTAITGATKTKITYDSKGLVTAGVDATTADIADSTDKRYQTDNQELYNDATSSIQTQLDSKSSFLISESGSLGQVTGTITNTIAASFLIPALPLFANKSLQINYTVLKVNSVSTCTVRLYINSTNSLTGATLLATSAFTTAQQVSNTIRTMGNIGAPFYLFYNPASSVFHDYLAFAYNPINILAGNYIIVAFQLGSPSEEARLRAINLRIL